MNSIKGLPMAGILLAAGKSQRMGRQKALMEIEGQRFVDEVREAMSAHALTPKILVLSPGVENKLSLKPDEQVLRNEQPDRGQLFSLQLALGKLEENPYPDGAMIFLVDNPLLLLERTNRLAQAVALNPSVVHTAAHRQERGHPLWLPRRLWPEVLAYKGEGGLKGFFEQHKEKVVSVEVGTESALHDIDAPEDYERLVQKIGKNHEKD